MMHRLLWGCLAAGILLGRAGAALCAGPVIYQPAYVIDEVLREPAQSYRPQPGDIFLSTDKNSIYRIAHQATFAGAPQHSGIVVARPDGRLAILESGPFNSMHVGITDIEVALKTHAERGEIVWFRQRREPLTPEQCADLTVWAERQDGKRFALLRLLGQGTLLRSRGPLKTYFLGGPHGERSSYFCSELVMETCVHVGLVPAADARPAATYPCDLFYEHSNNLFLNEHLHLGDSWYPPARCLWDSDGLAPCP